jgi:hypothetical protein
VTGKLAELAEGEGHAQRRHGEGGHGEADGQGRHRRCAATEAPGREPRSVQTLLASA